MSEQIRALIQQANEAVRESRFDHALALADQVLALEPDQADALVIRGIALASMSSPEAATEAFQRAIAVNPRYAKAYFNLAVHWFNLGRLEEAKVMAGQALALDPTHAQSRDLIANIEHQRSLAAQENVYREAPPQSQGLPAPEYGSRPQEWMGQTLPPFATGHSIPVVARMGSTWGLLFWLLFAGMVVSLGAAIAQFGPMFDLITQGAAQSDVTAKATEIQSSPAYVMTGLVSNICWLGLIVWGIMDIIDRRSSWAWLLLFVCCTVFLPLYWFLGRPNVDGR